MYSEIKISLLTGMRRAIQLMSDGMLESGTESTMKRVMDPDSDATAFLSSTVVAKYRSTIVWNS